MLNDNNCNNNTSIMHLSAAQEYTKIEPKGKVSKVDPNAPCYINEWNNPKYTPSTLTKLPAKKCISEALVMVDLCEVTINDVPYTKGGNGKWTSVTVQVLEKDADMIYTLCENVDWDPRVKFKI
eukprot:9013594-Ditylum_brightwellii.AAC.1